MVIVVLDLVERAYKKLVCMLLRLGGKSLQKNKWLLAGVEVFAIMKLDDLPNQKTRWAKRKE